MIETSAEVAFGETNFGFRSAADVVAAGAVVVAEVVAGVANVKLRDPFCVGPPLDAAGTAVAA